MAIFRVSAGCGRVIRLETRPCAAPRGTPPHGQKRSYGYGGGDSTFPDHPRGDIPYALVVDLDAGYCRGGGFAYLRQIVNADERKFSRDSAKCNAAAATVPLSTATRAIRRPRGADRQFMNTAGTCTNAAGARSGGPLEHSTMQPIGRFSANIAGRLLSCDRR